MLYKAGTVIKTVFYNDIFRSRRFFSAAALTFVCVCVCCATLRRKVLRFMRFHKRSWCSEQTARREQLMRSRKLFNEIRAVTLSARVTLNAFSNWKR